jgi:hypothetical protein
MNPIEIETIGLCISLEALNDIANHTLLEVRPVASLPAESEVYFRSPIHQEMFLIRLLDFTKEKTTRSITGVSGSCLDVLGAVSTSRCFDINGSAMSLTDSVTALRDWLEAKTKLKLWIPSIQINAEIVLSRSLLLFILGNHVKHNLARLTGVSETVGKLLREHGYSVQEEQIPLALEDIHEHLQENYFVYYGTWLAELINNVRWGLQDYLTPLFQESYVSLQDNRYEYKYPPDLSDVVARQWFWRLMNHVRSQPYISRFTGAHYLKRVSSLEQSL